MKLTTLLGNEKFILEVTMPHSMEHVQAVLKGGAQAIKVRCNNKEATRLSNGIVNGPFRDTKDFLQGVIDAAGEVPIGLLPGYADTFITQEEAKEVEDMGFDYFLSRPSGLPPYMMRSQKLGHVMVTVAEDENLDDLYASIDACPFVDAVEVNVVTKEEMCKPLVYGDILRLYSVAKKLHQPIIAPAQRIMKPEDVRHFYEAGCRCLMLGNVVFGAEEPSGTITPETCYRVTSEFREAVDKL